MNPSSSQPRVQRGFDPENEGYITPREQSPYLAALFRYISALNAMDFDTLTEVFDSKLVHSILPTSLQRPVVNYDQYIRYIDDVTEMFIELRINVHEVIEENHKMTVQATANGRGRSERTFANELVLIIHFDKVSSRDMRKYGSNGGNWPLEALPKMVNVKEFVDSLNTKTWFKEERQWMKENPQIVAEQRMQRRGEWKKDIWRIKQSMLQGGLPGVPGQPTQFAQGSPSAPGYSYLHQSPYSTSQGYSTSRSQGQGQGQGYSPTSSRGFGPVSTSLGTPGQAYSYTRPGPGYPSSYHPNTKDKYSGN